MSTCDIAYVKSDYVKKVMTSQENRQRDDFSLVLRSLLLNHTSLGKGSTSSSSHIHNNLKQQIGLPFISPFKPTSRTFLIAPLKPNSTYVFQMACLDTAGYKYFSKQLQFTTGKRLTPLK